MRPQARALIAAALLLTAAPAATHAAIIVGTPGPDRLLGKSPSGDVLFGGGGADTLVGGPGNDVLYGVRAGNTIDAGGGDNYVEGGAGDDKITAADGRNTVYGGTGHDTITLGNGDNYVDPGGADDAITLGNGNNVVNGNSGGMQLRAGSGNNTVYHLSGPDTIVLGGGVNHVYLAGVFNYVKVDCGGNPQSVLHVNAAVDPTLKYANRGIGEGKIVGCPNVVNFQGPTAIQSIRAGTWEVFKLQGGDGPDKLFGGHGGGSIDGGGGDNVLWADWLHDTGGAQAKVLTTRITAGDGNNIVYGGRGTNVITLGNGRNFVRAGASNNTIAVGSGSNRIRLQGYGRNQVKLRGGSAYVESFARGPKPHIRCLNGAHGIVVYGEKKPLTNCKTMAGARTAVGKRLQVAGVEPIPDADPVVFPAPVPGDAAGVPRPDPTKLVAANGSAGS
ncbi:MAG: hypothetical protein J7513_07640 [Solirubrobacteraceae bacterium]|nr:hypothetical protein [Solirubrobacteraceae bacterium]